MAGTQADSGELSKLHDDKTKSTLIEMLSESTEVEPDCKAERKASLEASKASSDGEIIIPGNTQARILLGRPRLVQMEIS